MFKHMNKVSGSWGLLSDSLAVVKDKKAKLQTVRMAIDFGCQVAFPENVEAEVLQGMAVDPDSGVHPIFAIRWTEETNVTWDKLFDSLSDFQKTCYKLATSKKPKEFTGEMHRIMTERFEAECRKFLGIATDGTIPKTEKEKKEYIRNATAPTCWCFIVQRTMKEASHDIDTWKVVGTVTDSLDYTEVMRLAYTKATGTPANYVTGVSNPKSESEPESDT